jgi:hypothetical protein
MGRFQKTASAPNLEVRTNDYGVGMTDADHKRFADALAKVQVKSRALRLSITALRESRWRLATSRV